MKIYDYNGKKNICGKRVRQARRALELTQTELAELLCELGVDIERDSVSRLEAGDRFVADYELPALSKVLRVPVLWLLGQDDTQ